MDKEESGKMIDPIPRLFLDMSPFVAKLMRMTCFF